MRDDGLERHLTYDEKMAQPWDPYDRWLPRLNIAAMAVGVIAFAALAYLVTR